jgi:hypothetical protein
MRTVAIATTGGDGASHARSVRAKNQAGTKKKRSKESEPQERATESGLEGEGREHEWSVGEDRKKTDGAGELGGSGQRF